MAESHKTACPVPRCAASLPRHCIAVPNRPKEVERDVEPWWESFDPSLFLELCRRRTFFMENIKSSCFLCKLVTLVLTTL